MKRRSVTAKQYGQLVGCHMLWDSLSQLQSQCFGRALMTLGIPLHDKNFQSQHDLVESMLEGKLSIDDLLSEFGVTVAPLHRAGGE